MKLYIFEPWEKWAYMGGAICVIAESYEHAVELIKQIDGWDGEKEHKDSIFAKDVSEFDPSWAPENWLLTHTLKLDDNPQPKVIVNNYNYS